MQGVLQLLFALSHTQVCWVVAGMQCGPRFEMKLYQIKLGTMDQAHAENEWVLRSYTRAAKKARLAVDEEPET